MREGWEEWESQNSGINAESTLLVTIPYNLFFLFSGCFRLHSMMFNDELKWLEFEAESVQNIKERTKFAVNP